MENLRIPRRPNSSRIWRGICEMWNIFKEDLGKKIGNGHDTSFWFENWSNANAPLIDFIQGWEGFIDKDEKVSDYVDSSGCWNIAKLQTWFPLDIINRIVCAYPPCEERGEDRHIWKPSTDGSFSVKSAYNFLSAGTQRQPDNIWKATWKWQILEKMKAFMWLFAHGRAHTAELRMRRGLTDHALCPFGCDSIEDSIHLIRDCPNAMNRWKDLVDPSHCPIFFSLQGNDWIKWNLNHEAGISQTKKISWNILFGYVCWDVWVARCNKLYHHPDVTNGSGAQSTFFRACWDKDLMEHCSCYGSKSLDLSTATSLPNRHIKLQVDGSVLLNAMSGCGGVIKDETGRWLFGFSSKLTTVPSAMAELIAIIQGLNLCWVRGYKNIVVYFDCIEAIDFCTKGCDGNYPFRDIVDEARQTIHKEWQVLLIYSPRENLIIADYLAKASHNMEANFCILDQSPPIFDSVDLDEGG